MSLEQRIAANVEDQLALIGYLRAHPNLHPEERHRTKRALLDLGGELLALEEQQLREWAAQRNQCERHQ